jgi:hypothetical protein
MLMLRPAEDAVVDADIADAADDANEQTRAMKKEQASNEKRSNEKGAMTNEQ